MFARHPKLATRALAAGGVALLLLALVLVLRPRARQAPKAAVRASWAMTPGVVNAAVTQATIGTTICVRGWTRTIRPPTSYTGPLKLEQMRAYAVGGTPSAYQEDHLISLELGGHPTDPRNLWPEPRPRAEEVDQLENELHDAVCAGRLSLAAAQLKISEVKHGEG